MIYTKDNPKLVRYSSSFEGKETFTGVVKDKYNDIVYYLNGKYHREDGPAIEFANGDKYWILNNQSHREDGPAVEFVNGYKAWSLNGERYGENDDFTSESWIKFVQLQLLK